MQTKATERSYTVYLTHEDRIDVRLRRNRNRVIDFTLNYRARLDGRWKEIIRYDTAHHQPLHRHRFWPPHEGEKDCLQTHAKQDYSQEFTRWRRHLRTHWREYRQRSEAHHRR